MCVIDIKHFPVMTLRQKPSRCLTEGRGVWENAVSYPSETINLGVFSHYSFAESDAFCLQSLIVVNHKEARGFTPLG